MGVFRDVGEIAVVQIVVIVALAWVLGFIGVGLGFALKDYAGSLIAGTVSLYENRYRPGDWVSIDGAYGEVQSINLRTLSILTP